MLLRPIVWAKVYSLPWKMFYVHVKRMYILQLLSGEFYKCKNWVFADSAVLVCYALTDFLFTCHINY